MTSFISHTAVPIAIASAAGKRNVPRSLLATGIAASLIPDLDVVGLLFGIPHEHFLGHRGLSHSPVFGLATALLSLLAWRKLGPSRPAVFGVVFVSILSHGLLDAITHGGIGVAFLSPFSNERFLFPWRPIPVAPLELSLLLTSQGLMVVLAEVAWVWVPCLMIGLFCRLFRTIKAMPGKPLKQKNKAKFFNPALAWEARQRVSA
jgi:inner membrane protein